MVYFSKDAEDSFNKLLYYPYTIGKHLGKAATDVKRIMDAFSLLPIGAHGVLSKRTIPNIGTITYYSTPTSHYIQFISWSNTLTKFYYVKSNFITFAAKDNIPSVHPYYYKVRNEDGFKCDNGYKVVSRLYKGREVFNFIDTSKGYIRLVSDIDFTQVLPFSEYKDMTARGYTPDRRCWMVFEDGKREEVNESKKVMKPNVIRLTETELRQVIAESVRTCIRRML